MVCVLLTDDLAFTEAIPYRHGGPGTLVFAARVTADGQSKLVNGAGTNTFPTYVSSMTKHSKNLPSVFALSTLMLLFTCTLVGLSKLLTAKNQTKLKGKSE